ncbi:GtrA family protein [Paracrocinitomix mangrovi]|uniref:GtrA family protein n=1 Tax=Paracrocinitomix mangrovi TaxID=2862509 RepID=UPI001C8DA0AA|nr:GtrA family protein [Paracrocinitomix mangrovi]UKN02141.1 GtrA family protein [Paracrocinitomix mangrovi]
MSKFMLASVIATLVDIILFTFVLTQFLPVFESELIAGFVGMCINFFIQKKYVFELKRNQVIAFALSISLSLVAILLGGLIVKFLVTFDFFATYLILAKLIVVGIKFFFNFFTKRWVFERKGIKGKGLS